VGNGSGEEARPKPKSNDVAAEKFIQSISVFNGAALKKVRQLQGFSVEDIAERTKIRKTYIEYLEEEQFTFLPAEVYVKGFVSMIAGMLGLPVQRVVDDYMRSYHRGDSTG
jgi:cytoskeletal protein RodZ